MASLLGEAIVTSGKVALTSKILPSRVAPGTQVLKIGALSADLSGPVLGRERQRLA